MTIEIQDVTIRYGATVAVSGLTTTIPSGIIGLLGRNGAGKSSVLKALLGLVKPAEGRLRVEGLPEHASGEVLRRQVGYMPERDAWLPQTSGFGMVSLLARLSGLGRRDAQRRAHEVLYLVGLDEQRYRPVAGYSLGTRQRVKLACALVHDPAILLLDEPTNGLDPEGRRDMLRLVRQLGRELGKSVVLSTHILQDVEAVCDSAVVMERGRLVAQGSLDGLTQHFGRGYVLTLVAPIPGVGDFLRDVGRPEQQADGRILVWLDDRRTSQDVFLAVLRAGASVRSLVPFRRSLEDVFLQAVDSAAAGPASGSTPSNSMDMP